MVIAIEFDAGNGYNELHGISGVTQGDWITGTPYPIVNPEGPDRDSILGAYAVWFYPMVYRVCPNKEIAYVGIPTKADMDLYLQYCTQITGMPEMPAKTEKVYVDFYTGNLHCTGFDLMAAYSLYIYDVSGKAVLQLNPVQRQIMSLNSLQRGTYFFSLFKNSQNACHGKFVLY